jgi:hypothetical protein
MNRLIFNALLMLSSASSVMGFSSQKLNTNVPGVDYLKSNVEKSFLEKANNPKSQLNKTLTIFNQDHTDGRNSNGVIPKTLGAGNIKIIPISGEDQFGRYCSQISNKPGHSLCSNGLTETYLILIPYKMGVHKAVGYDTIQFIVSAEKKAEWKMDAKDKEYDRKETIKVNEPTSISVNLTK